MLRQAMWPPHHIEGTPPMRCGGSSCSTQQLTCNTPIRLSVVSVLSWFHLHGMEFFHKAALRGYTCEAGH